MNKDVRQLVRQLVTIPGVTIDQSGHHLKVMRDGVFLVTMPKTPSDHRWRANAMRELRAKGLTPPTKAIAPELVVAEELPVEELRDELERIFRVPGNQADFARFTVEVADVLGLDGYKNAKSAEASLHWFKGGGGLSPGKRILLEESLRMWKQRNASMFRAERAKTPEPEPMPEPEPEVPVLVSAGGGKVQLQLDLDTLNGLLARVGITLVIE